MSDSGSDTISVDQPLAEVIEESALDISEEEKNKLVEFLIHMGAVCVDDMMYLTDDDLIPYLLPVKRRKFLHFLKQKMQNHCQLSKSIDKPSNVHDQTSMAKSDLILDYTFQDQYLPDSILTCFEKNLSKNLVRFLTCMQSIQLRKKGIKTIVKEVTNAKQITKDDQPEIVGVLNLLCEYFQEDFGTLVVKESTAPFPVTPCVVARGSSVYTAASFDVMVDGVLIFTDVASAADAVTMFFASFYIFNIQYPVTNALTLEFLQCIEVSLPETGEVFPVNEVSSFTEVRDLKVKLELIAGIPTHLQRIMYLDQGDMEDESTLKHHDVVAGARLTMHIWSSWSSLIKASSSGNIKKVLSLGVTADSDFCNPNIKQMSAEAKKDYFLSRSAIALYVAAHRGHIKLMKVLLKAGSDIAAQTKFGRTALHVAAAGGQNDSIDILLNYGAGDFVNQEDKLGATPLQIATDWSHKSSERRLFLYQWRRRASKMPKILEAEFKDLMAHQLYDSSSSTWLRGTRSQLYHSNILPPQEFQGTSLDAKRSEHKSLDVSPSSSKTRSNSYHNSSPLHIQKSSQLQVHSNDAVMTRGYRKSDSSTQSLVNKKSVIPKGRDIKQSKFASKKTFSIDSKKEKGLCHSPKDDRHAARSTDALPARFVKVNF